MSAWQWPCAGVRLTQSRCQTQHNGFQARGLTMTPYTKPIVLEDCWRSRLQSHKAKHKVTYRIRTRINVNRYHCCTSVLKPLNLLSSSSSHHSTIVLWLLSSDFAAGASLHGGALQPLTLKQGRDVSTEPNPESLQTVGLKVPAGGSWSA